jgi:hypothetical protein
MNIKKKIFGIIIATSDYKGIFNHNKELFNQLSKGFTKVYVLNMLAFKFREDKKKIKNQKILPKNFIFLNFTKSIDFLNFFKNRQMIAIQYLDKNPSFFKIFFLIKLAKIKNIMVMNLGNFGNKITPDFNTKHVFAFAHYYQKGFYYLFRILTILNIFPKIDLLFESDIRIIKNHNNGLSRRFEKTFPFFKISYFRKIELVNSVFFKQDYKIRKKSKKYILYVDVPINHGDKVIREGYADKNTEENFYLNLNIFLERLSKILNLKIAVGLHPSNNIGFKYLNKFEIKKKRTLDLIPNCEIAVFTHSSLISSALMLKKNILFINSEFMGKYHTDLTNRYVKSLGSFSINIDKPFMLKKIQILNKIKNSVNNYNKYIKTRLNADGRNLPNEKIIKKIKEYFFKY